MWAWADVGESQKRSKTCWKCSRSFSVKAFVVWGGGRKPRLYCRHKVQTQSSGNEHFRVKHPLKTLFSPKYLRAEPCFVHIAVVVKAAFVFFDLPLKVSFSLGGAKGIFIDAAVEAVSNCFSKQERKGKVAVMQRMSLQKQIESLDLHGRTTVSVCGLFGSRVVRYSKSPACDHFPSIHNILIRLTF